MKQKKTEKMDPPRTPTTAVVKSEMDPGSHGAQQFFYANSGVLLIVASEMVRLIIDGYLRFLLIRRK